MLLQIPIIALIASLAVILPIISGSITVTKHLSASSKIIFVYCIIYAIFRGNSRLTISILSMLA